MNTRSIRFQLIVWYASLVTGVMAALGIATWFVVRGYLESSLSESQLRRARQIAHALLPEAQRKGDAYIGEEIETRYAPATNGRFVRVSRANGSVLYVSGPPSDASFDSTQVAAPDWPPPKETSYKVSLADDRALMLAAYAYQSPSGERFLVEVGAPLATVQAVLRQFLLVLAIGLPVVAALAVGGGYFLVNRALSPVDEIIRSAERITSQNLGERLPTAKTGDELERLCVALNHMISRLDEAFQYSKRFVADASHELRTPLTVLRGELEALLQDAKLSEHRSVMAGLLEETERLANIVEGLFALSRLDAGEAQRESVRFDLGQLAASTADQMALLAEDKKIAVTCDAPEGVVIEGDRARLKQVIVNLLDNAIKYTPDGGAVGLAVSTRNGTAVLEVSDNGMGIPAEALPHVFERFFRVDKARSRELGGAGLGLSIVKSICAAHHGRVEAMSSPGQGSRFRVELPLAAGNKQHPSKS